MRLHASATYRPRSDVGRFIEARVSPGVKAGVSAITTYIETTAKQLCPRRTGALAESIHSEVTETDKTVVGVVSVGEFYGPYVEFGTGIAGASSTNAGPGPYRPDWPGMVPQPYMRPALDAGRQISSELMRSEVAVGLR